MCAGSAAADDPGAPADVARTLSSTSWGAVHADWRASHPDVTCESFRSYSSSNSLDEEWSYRCRSDAAASTSQWFFYVLDVPGAPAARLEQFRARIPVMPPAQPEQVLDALSSRISERYGPAERLATPPAEFGSAFWRTSLRWHSADVEIFAYHDTDVSQPGIGVLARHRPLIERLGPDRFSHDGLAWMERTEEDLDAALLRALAPVDADAHRRLTAYRATRDTPGRAPYRETAIAVQQIVDRAPRAAAERRPLLLLTADRLAATIAVDTQQSAEWDALRNNLAVRGATYQWSPLGGTWRYQHELLWRVWKEFPSTPWGEWAFVLLLQRGWDTTVGCGGGSDQFHAIIREGQAFLARRPKSPHRVDVQYAVALAYETWWSLAHAGEHDAYAEPARYQSGADTARRKAIELYQPLGRLTTDSVPVRHARRVLGRLRLALATSERAFFCVYD